MNERKEITGRIVEMDKHETPPDVEMFIKVLEDTPKAEILHKVEVPLGLGDIVVDFWNMDGITVSVDEFSDRLVFDDVWEAGDLDQADVTESELC